MFEGYISGIIHNILKRAIYIGKLIIKTTWLTSRSASCIVSVNRNNPVPSVEEGDNRFLCDYFDINTCACVLFAAREGVSQCVGLVSDAYWEAFFSEDPGDFAV